MNPKIYDLSIAAGVLSCAGGSYLMGGASLALIVGGALVLVMTVTGLMLVKR